MARGHGAWSGAGPSPSPQAWSTGAPLLLLRAGLGLEPQGDNLVVDPALPKHFPVTTQLAHPKLFTASSTTGTTNAYRVIAVAEPANAGTTVVAVPLADVVQTLHRLLLVESLVAAGVLLLVFVPQQTPEPVLAVLAAWLGFFGLGWYGPWVAYLAETAPADQVGLTLGAAMAINQIGIIGAPPLLGLVHDLSGGYTALWGAVVAALAAAYALTGLIRQPRA